MKALDLTGQRFGKLTVVEKITKRKKRKGFVEMPLRLRPIYATRNCQFD